MSWADIIRKKPDETAPPVVKQLLFVKPAISSEPNINLQAETSTTRILPPDAATRNVRVLVLDTGALLRASGVGDLADEYYTVSDVLKEVRDARHREALENLTYEIKVANPNQQSLQAVLEAAKKTGDLGALSRTDLRVMALAHQLSTEAECIGVVKEEIAVETKDSDDDGDDEDPDAPESPEGQEGGEENKDEEDESDDEGWITPENIQHHRVLPEGTTLVGDSTNTIKVSCLTIDFAMQNALLHMGVPVIGTDGRRITRLRTWIMRCHACFTLVHDSTRQFCPACGSGDTLKKVSYTVDASGERQVWINWKRRLNTRGVRFNLPKPRWGSRGTNRTLVLREDQLKDFGKSKSAKMAQKLKEISAPEAEIFGKAPNKKSSHEAREKSSYQKFNVNERRNIRASRRK